MSNKAICTASTIERLQRLINQYFYSTTYVVDPENLKIYNSKGEYTEGEILKTKTRYIFQPVNKTK